jgi:replicative DNA helicase
MPQLLDHLSRLRDRPVGMCGVPTGFPALDGMIPGLQPGDLVILAARPSVGKSALALSIARNLAVDQGVGVGIITLEMSRLQVAQRLLSAQSRLDLHQLRTGRLAPADWQFLQHHANRLARAPIHIDETAGMTILEARARARRLCNRHQIGLVVVDYLQLMDSGEPTATREQEVAAISRGLKALAKELQVPVLALSQLSRAVETRPDHRPQLSDLRESGSLEQDADVVLFIYRQGMHAGRSTDHPAEEDTAEIIVAKQRNGPTGSVRLQWNAPCASFSEPEPGWDAQEPGRP